MSKKIFVVGCGRWGTFIAWYLDHIGHSVTLYGRPSSKRMQELMETRANEYMKLSDTMELTTSMEGMAGVDIVVISVGAQQLRGVAEEIAARGITEKKFVLCMKGLEIATGKRLSEIATEILDSTNAVAVWLGPGHVQEFYRGVPNCMVIDSEDDEVKHELVEEFSSDLIRFYYGTDLIGNEIGGAAKNVVGIAAGMLDGVGLTSLKGALMARGTSEIGRLIVAMGGKERTVYGLCHLGDYEATLFSSHSHNLTYGRCIVKNEPYDKLAEGYYTVEALRKMGKEYQVELPICEAVYQIIYEKKDPMTVLQSLFDRKLKDEL